MNSRIEDSWFKGVDSWFAGVCFGYILGVAESEEGFMKPCIPSGVSREQLVRVVHKHLREHPEHTHEDANSLVTDALFIAFPCSEQ